MLERGKAVAEKKVIAVVGATGARGGGLAPAILADADADGDATATAASRCGSQFCDVRDLDVVRNLNPQQLNFQQWLTTHKDALAIA